MGLEAPATVAAGAVLEVAWRGPNGPRDNITLVPKGTEDGSYQEYQYTRNDSPLQFQVPDTPGDYELRYQSDDVTGVYDRRPIRVE